VVCFGTKITGDFAIFVRPINQDVTLKRVQLSVFDHEGLLLRSTTDEIVGKVTRPNAWGAHRMLSLDKLQGPSLVVFCLLEYLPQGAVPLAGEDFKTQLQSDVVDMFETGYFSDVKFVVQGEEMDAHKSVLVSRSAYFTNMFLADMKESHTNRVEVTDISPAVFKTVLKFLYGSIPEQTEYEELKELIVAADKYEIDELKEMCESVLSANLSVDQVIDAMLFAEMHNCDDLLARAKRLFKANIKVLKENQTDWCKLKERPDLLLELLERCTE